MLVVFYIIQCIHIVQFFYFSFDIAFENFAFWKYSQGTFAQSAVS